MSFLLAAVGLVLLLFAGDALVRGAVALSLRLGIPPFIVSLTIVGFGTSAPELLIAIEAALEGLPGIALGNVVGSNIANVFLVLGVPALVAPLLTSGCDTKETYFQMLGATAIFVVLCFLGPLVLWHGVVLLAILTLMLTRAFLAAQSARRSGQEMTLEDLEDADPDMPTWKMVAYLLGGVVGLPLGAALLIEGAEDVARLLGVSEEVIGLTLVALGTSLPELATTVMAAIRRQAEVALGNVIGSNMFNLLAIMGIASLFGPLPVAPELLMRDIWVMVAAALALIPFVLMGRDMGRGFGIAFLAIYLIYIATLF
ncbi:MAG: calcium/sodium antiporter [Pseudomonadota bacterium]